MKNGILRVSIGVMLFSAAQPAWALGDFVIPQTAGLLIGGPVLILLVISLVVAATKGNKDDPASQVQWEKVALWGALFNGLWLWLLFIFDPDTWNTGENWSGAGFVMRYLFPNAVLVAFLLFKGWIRRAAALAASCLLMGVGYWIL